jgi:hypothetical protein
MPVFSMGGSRFFVTFTDDKSRRSNVFCITNKSDVFGCFKKWQKQVERQSGRSVRVLRTDNGGEYLSREFKQYLEQCGIKHQLTIPYTPEQNGVAERLNRTLLDSARTMLKHMDCDKRWWAEAVSTACYIKNRITTTGLPNDVTPHEVWFGRKPNISHLRVFGSKCWYVTPKSQRSKLDKRSCEAVMVGYSENQKGYKLWDANSKKMITSRDVKFLETQNNLDGTSKLHLDKDVDTDSVNRGSLDERLGEDGDEPTENAESVIDAPAKTTAPDGGHATVDTAENVITDADGEHAAIDSTADNVTTDASNTIESTRKSTRTRRAPGKWWANCAFVSTTTDPTTLHQAMKRSDAGLWKDAMRSEYNSLLKHGTWKLVTRPANLHVIPCKWVFKTKPVKNGAGLEMQKYKARLVAKGYSQIHGVDYDETFAPVVKFTSIRILLAMVTHFDLELHQMDVVTAFLNGDLDEIIHMEQPEGFINSETANKVCLLLKALYGLKQANRQWHAKMDTFLCAVLGFTRNAADCCLYVRTKGGVISLIALYVDDLLIACTDVLVLNEIKEELSQHFDMKDMGEAKKVLGLEICRNRTKRNLTLSQAEYAASVLHRYGMGDAYGVSTPIDGSVDLYESSESASDMPYREAIGSLIYLMVGTRPDIAYAMSQLSKFVESPTILQWNAVKRVMRYIKHTTNLGLCYRGDAGFELKGHCDSDWGGDKLTRRSTSGYIFCLSGAAVSWCSKRQTIVALSSTESEYVGLCFASKEAIWLRRMVNNLGIADDRAKQPVIILADNQGSIKLANNSTTSKRTKHIDIQYHFTRSAVENDEVKFDYCHTSEMLADVLTKALQRVKVEEFVKLAGLVRSSG